MLFGEKTLNRETQKKKCCTIFIVLALLLPLQRFFLCCAFFLASTTNIQSAHKLSGSVETFSNFRAAWESVHCVSRNFSVSQQWREAIRAFALWLDSAQFRANFWKFSNFYLCHFPGGPLSLFTLSLSLIEANTEQRERKNCVFHLFSFHLMLIEPAHSQRDPPGIHLNWILKLPPKGNVQKHSNNAESHSRCCSNFRAVSAAPFRQHNFIYMM